ncbi:MAG: NADH-quinone oxidoreductase subunit N [Elusimicrobia bacterium]|nr:NADH-quinone oxidoreductase subunit N [Elusimicrobiota bacterium]
MTPESIPLSLFAPQLPIAGALAGALLAGMFSKHRSGTLARIIGAAGVLAGSALLFWGPPYADTWLVRAGGIARAWQLFFHLAALAFLASHRAQGEQPVALLLAALLGMDLIAAANDLLALYLGLELMSLPTYLLVYGLKPQKRSLEAAVKYFFAGGAASGMFLFGLSIWYAGTGTTALAPGGMLDRGPSSAASLAFVLMGSAALFKVGAFPFHFWLPDVYEASEPELGAFMSTAVKAAGFLMLMLLSIGHSSFDPIGNSGALFPNLGAWLPVVSVATMTVGNLLALRQTNLRRLLGYSSIAHVGTLLSAVWVWQAGGHGEELATIWFYLGATLFMNTGAFLFLKLAGISQVSELRGYGSRAPWAAAFFALMLLSLGGIPPTSGFLAKFYVVWDLLKGGGIGLAAAVAFNSLLGLGYYLNLIRVMALEEPGQRTPAEPPRPDAGTALVLLCCAAAATVGFLPEAREWLFTLMTL